jgi:hypothetical protein
MLIATSVVGLAGIFTAVAVADGGVVSPLPTAKAAPPAATAKGPPTAPAPPVPPPQLAPTLLIGPVQPGYGQGERRYDLRPAKDGTDDLLYEGPGYTARVRTDGTVRFDDKSTTLSRGLSLIPFMPLPIPGNPTTLQGVAMEFLGKKRKAPPRRTSPRDAPDPPLPVPNPTRYRPDPREACAYGDPCFWYGDPMLGQVTGRFDATDEIMRFNGKDPYRYEKALFLAGTREVRIGMAVRSLAADVRRAAAELDAKLIEVGCDETRSRAERRAILTALSAELDGDSPAARAAVEKIARFVATHLDAAPDGGAACGVSP